MTTLSHSGSISPRNGKSFASSSPLAVRTVPVRDFKPDTKSRKNRIGKEKNHPAVRRDVQFFPGLLIDYALFSFILAADAMLTAEISLRDRFRTTETLPS